MDRVLSVVRLHSHYPRLRNTSYSVVVVVVNVPKIDGSHCACLFTFQTCVS